MLTIGGESVLAIDSDAHVIESEKTWSYLAPAEQHWRPVLVGSSENPAQQYWVIQDKIRGFRFPNLVARALEELSERTGRDMNTDQATRELASADLRVRHMDELGIDIQVLHNTLWIEQVTNRPDGELALCRSYNRWLADLWAHGQGRLRWSCLPPTLSIAEAIEEVRWCKQHGAVGICLRPLEGDRHLTDPYFYPLYEAAQRLDLPITVHIANGNPVNADLVRHSRFWTFRVPTVSACQVYLVSEVPALFPKLRMGFIEAGAQWLPWVLNESKRRGLQRLPFDEMLREQRVWVTCENEDDLAYVVQWAGEDNLLIGTDYGHTDPSSNVRAMSMFVERTDITDAVKRKIIDDNARAYYGIKDDELPAPAARQESTTTTVGGGR
jgi:predicted TIM-barrel fold metal-dependent hydrolase